MERIDMRPITSDAYLYLKVLVTHYIIFKLHEVFALVIFNPLVGIELRKSYFNVRLKPITNLHFVTILLRYYNTTLNIKACFIYALGNGEINLSVYKNTIIYNNA